MTKHSNIDIIDDPRQDLSQEKSFWEAIRASIGTVGNKADALFCVCIFVVANTLLVWACLAGNLAHPAVIAEIISKWSLITVGYSASVFGFLIAGFSIFATLTKPELFHALARIKQKGRKISEFKFIFYNYLYIFALFLLYITTSLATYMLSQFGSPAWYFAKIIHQRNPELISFFSGFTLITLCSFTLYTILLLKSFLWTLYQTIITAIFYNARATISCSSGENSD